MSLLPFRMSWIVVALLSLTSAEMLRADDGFPKGVRDYEVGNYATAAETFAGLSRGAPSVAAFHNLGNAEWQLGHVGPAVLAWERAQWLGPWEGAPKQNLRFARNHQQLESPRLRWHEVVASWLPMSIWAWTAAGSFWLALAALIVPSSLRWRRGVWNQALAALSFGLFLATLPGLIGVQSRLGLVVVLESQTPVKLTPTLEAQTFTRLSAGEVVRVERTRKNYAFVRLAGDAAGWVEMDRIGRIAGK